MAKMKYHWPSCELKSSNEPDQPLVDQNIFWKVFLTCFCLGAPWVLLAQLYNFRPVNLIFVSGVVAGIIVGRKIKTSKKGVQK